MILNSVLKRKHLIGEGSRVKISMSQKWVHNWGWAMWKECFKHEISESFFRIKFPNLSFDFIERSDKEFEQLIDGERPKDFYEKTEWILDRGKKNSNIRVFIENNSRDIALFNDDYIELTGVEKLFKMEKTNVFCDSSAVIIIMPIEDSSGTGEINDLMVLLEDKEKKKGQ
jgi:hypothetical protein